MKPIREKNRNSLHGWSVKVDRIGSNVKKAKSPFVMLLSWARNKNRALSQDHEWQYTTTVQCAYNTIARYIYAHKLLYINGAKARVM